MPMTAQQSSFPSSHTLQCCPTSDANHRFPQLTCSSHSEKLSCPPKPNLPAHHSHHDSGFLYFSFTLFLCKRTPWCTHRSQREVEVAFFSHRVDPSGLSAEPPCQPQTTCSLRSTNKSTPTTPALWGLRREDQELKTSLGYTVKLS